MATTHDADFSLWDLNVSRIFKEIDVKISHLHLKASVVFIEMHQNWCIQQQLFPRVILKKAKLQEH